MVYVLSAFRVDNEGIAHFSVLVDDHVHIVITAYLLVFQAYRLLMIPGFYLSQFGILRIIRRTLFGTTA
jgi:hypothetical protein